MDLASRSKSAEQYVTVVDVYWNGQLAVYLCTCADLQHADNVDITYVLVTAQLGAAVNHVYHCMVIVALSCATAARLKHDRLSASEDATM